MPNQDSANDDFSSRIAAETAKLDHFAEAPSAADSDTNPNAADSTAADHAPPPSSDAESTWTEGAHSRRRVPATTDERREPNGFPPAKASSESPAGESTGESAAPSAGPVGTGQRVVRDGEGTVAIANETGHFWETIWNDPANTELRELRKDPNVLLAGDRITVPPLRDKAEPCNTEMRHRFRRRGEPAKLSLVVKRFDKPMANQPFIVEIDKAKRHLTGMTDGEGKVDIAIPGNARHAKLTVGVDPAHRQVFEFKLGGIDPISEICGAQTRLRNLGFECEITDELDNATRAALRQFQKKYELPVTGEPDDVTKAKLLEVHKG